MQKHVEPDDFEPVPRRRSTVLAVPLLIFAGMAAMFLFALRAGDPSKLPSALPLRDNPSQASRPPISDKAKWPW
jgi:cytochrome c biogenesis protein CcmG, thiol:disulfide interchange protein DsbE